MSQTIVSEGFFSHKNTHICLIIYLPFKRGLPHLSVLNTILETAWLPEKTDFERIADARLSQRQPSCLLFAQKKRKKQHKAVLVSSSLKPNQQRKDVSTRALDPPCAHGSTPTGDHTETHLTKFLQVWPAAAMTKPCRVQCGIDGSVPNENATHCFEPYLQCLRSGHWTEATSCYRGLSGNRREEGSVCVWGGGGGGGARARGKGEGAP